MKRRQRRIREALCLIVALAVAAAGATGAAGAGGASWPVMASPNVGSGGNTLWGVTALSPEDAWAVGDVLDPAVGAHPLIEHWNGDAWTVVPSPTTGVSASPSAVAGISPTDVWAVGRFAVEGSSEAVGRTFVQHWNGSDWQIVPSPNAGIEPRGNGTLAGVFALATDDVWAVGSYYPRETNPTLQPLIEHWNGEEWEVVPGPSESPGPWSELSDVSGSGPTDI
jgi:hypothetical protein